MVKLIAVTIAVIAVAATFFMNYPPPPQSPIIYQWRNDNASFFQFEGYNIFYKDFSGNGTDNIICLHGFPTSSFDWYKVWPNLTRQFGRVIAVDFLGMGFSDKPRFHSYSIMEQANIVEHLLKLLGVKAVHILAHDYGDTVVQELLAREREAAGEYSLKIQSVCLLNGGIFPGWHHPRWSQKLLRCPIIGTIISKFGNYLTFTIALCEVFGSETQPERPELLDLWGIMRYQDGYRVLGSLLSYLDERENHESRWVGALQKTKVPVYVIYGQDDPVNPPPFADHYRSVIPKPKIIELPSVGHYVQLEAPEKMTQLYFSFIQRLAST